MSKVITDLLEGKTLLNKVGCAGMTQRVRSRMRGRDPKLEHTSFGQTMEARSGNRPQGSRKSKEYLPP
ncbi:MAG: hypothetical protein FJ117_15245 [Deltaproteobacteria bacterium]|nr:hypothetical protein [Deltaproteobacteria bacterium]